MNIRNYESITDLRCFLYDWMSIASECEVFDLSPGRSNICIRGCSSSYRERRCSSAVFDRGRNRELIRSFDR